MVIKIIKKIFNKNSSTKSKNSRMFDIESTIEALTNNIYYGKIDHPAINSKHYTESSFSRDVENIPYNDYDNFISHLLNKTTPYKLRKVYDIRYGNMVEPSFDTSKMEFNENGIQYIG